MIDAALQCIVPSVDETDTLALDQQRPRDGAPSGLSLRAVGDGLFVTHALPATGDLVIGRASDVDLRIEDPSISRRHVVLHLGPTITIEDVGSANGTRVAGVSLAPGVRAEVRPGEVVELGAVMVILQPDSTTAKPRRIWAHGYFEGRVEDECARAARSNSSFVVARLHVDGNVAQSEVHEAIAAVLGPMDMVALYGPGEYELLMFEVEPADAERQLSGLAVHAAVRAGVAWYPRDGRSAETLIARACDVLRGTERSREAVIIEHGPMERLHRMVDRIAQGNIGVLITGETGVGKEVMAEAIHKRSRRADKPFLGLNCAALSESLLESELFGYEPGAFTGALRPKPGLLETAEEGTVFLDEVGELPPSIQAKLLRVLEERRLRRVGGLETAPIDVRFVAATNRDLEEEVRRGRFRQDLLFRLNGFTLWIPPLRERKGEIPGLASAFIERAAGDLGLARAPRLSEPALELLMGYAWPGNIRELRNFLERAVLLCTGDVILPEHLPVEKMNTAMSIVDETEPSPDLKTDIDRLERDRILEALESCGGNQTRAAKMLGIARGTLSVRLDRYGIKRPRRK